MGEPRSRPEGGAEGADRKALDELDARIRAARLKLEPRRRSGLGKYHALTLAWRMVLELVIGTAIGAGIGYALDDLFGSKPWMMLVFGALGVAAGIKTMMASAREVQGRNAARSDEGNGLGER